MLFCAVLHTGAARGQDCLNLYDPLQVLTLNVTMDPADWDTLRFSCPGGVCTPPPHSYFTAFLSCENSPLILVGIRRKNNPAEPSDSDPQKVSLKIDINEFVPGQEFFGKKKLSLEGGDGGGLLKEGMTWNLYHSTGSFVTGRSAWVRVWRRW